MIIDDKMLREILEDSVVECDLMVVGSLTSGDYKVVSAPSAALDRINNSNIESLSGMLNYLLSLVSEVDRNYMAEILTVDGIKKHLSRSREIIKGYYMNFGDGSIYYYLIKFSCMSDYDTTGNIVISGIKEDDLPVRINEKYKAFASLSQDYETVYVVYTADDIFTPLKVDQRFAEVFRKYDKLGFFDGITKYIDDNVILQDKERVRAYYSKENVIERLFNKNLIERLDFCIEHDGSTHYVRVKTVCLSKKEQTFILATRLIDSDVARESQVVEELEEAIEKRTSELVEANIRLNRINDDIIGFMGDIVEARDVESGEHIRRVKGFTNILAKQVMNDLPEYKLDQRKVDLITSASALHDIGKIMISDSILLKPAKLTQDEFEIMKGHSIAGCEMLKKAPRDWSSDYLDTSMEICRWHHEKYDGKGYPDGLKGDEIPISAQIVSIADCYDALINKRCYKSAYPMDDAFNMIVNGECGAFSDKLLACFKKVKAKFELHATNESSLVGLDRNDEFIGRSEMTSMVVLFAEDNEITRDITVGILERAGAKVVTATDGYDAVEIFKSGEYAFDVILLDINMPGMDGPRTAWEIRRMKTDESKSVPIIAITASHADEDINRALEAGMNGYLINPISVISLTRILGEFTRKQSILSQVKLKKRSRVSGKDVLTGVKNIASYTEKISEITLMLEKNRDYQFAIVVIDFNGLKYINDTYGHEAGDLYVVNGCKVICQTFEKSPVYRIGGDGFVVFLEDDDYEALDEHLDTLKNEIVRLNGKQNVFRGRVSFAAGYARYDSNRDKSISDVLKRADESMLRNKNLMDIGIGR